MATLTSMTKIPEILVVLRMNRNLMVFMREKYFLEIKAPQSFNMAVSAPDIEEAEGES
jgi:hypothetical protein